jgi:hypothetical protein
MIAKVHDCVIRQEQGKGEEIGWYAIGEQTTMLKRLAHVPPGHLFLSN